MGGHPVLIDPLFQLILFKCILYKVSINLQKNSLKTLDFFFWKNVLLVAEFLYLRCDYVFFFLGLNSNCGTSRLDSGRKIS